MKLKSIINEIDVSILRDKADELKNQLDSDYPQIQELYFGVGVNGALHIMSFRIYPQDRRAGVGSEIMKKITDFADQYGMVITLSPAAERGYKDKLDSFYKQFGFVYNTGRNKDYRYSSIFGPIMYRRPKTKNPIDRIDEGAIKLHKLDRDAIDKYVDDLRKEIRQMWTYTTYVELESLTMAFQRRSDELKSNKFPFHIKYVTSAGSGVGGKYDHTTNTIFISVSMACEWKLDVYKKIPTYNCYTVDFRHIKEILYHEFIHYIQHVYRTEKEGDYTLKGDWMKNYFKRGWEQQAQAVGYLEKLKHLLDVKKPEDVLNILKSHGLVSNTLLHKLKTTDYKSWKAIMKQAIMTTLADMEEI